MTTNLTSIRGNWLNMLAVVVFSLVLAACGGGSGGTAPDGEGADPDNNPDPDVTQPDNPDNLDVNGDQIRDEQDDINGDGVVDRDDVIAFAAAQDPGPGTTDPNFLPGNIPPDCAEVDCVSIDSDWSNNAPVSQSKSPVSTYAMGIQRILFCQGIGTSADKTIEAYADGIFGKNTAMDVRTYQDLNDLLIDGEVGEMTWASLQRAISTLDTADPENTLFQVTSTREGCENLVQFVQLNVEPMNWRLVAEPGGTTYVPFSANSFDLP